MIRLSKDKFDIDAVAQLEQIPSQEIGPYLPEMLEWIQDLNWPVAAPMLKLLATHESVIVQHLEMILTSDDSIWKYNILCHLVPLLSKNVVIRLKPTIEAIELNPSEDDINEEVHLAAKDVKFE